MCYWIRECCICKDSVRASQIFKIRNLKPIVATFYKYCLLTYVRTYRKLVRMVLKKFHMFFIQFPEVLTYCYKYFFLCMLSLCISIYVSVSVYNYFFESLDTKLYTSWLFTPTYFSTYFLKTQKFCKITTVELWKSGNMTLIQYYYIAKVQIQILSII